MALQYSVAVRNAQLDALETTVGASAILEIRSGAAPATCATADSGTLLASMALPSDWMAAASAGAKALAGSWTDASANATGTAGHFRIKDNPGTTCHAQGTITTTAVGTGDMLLDNTSITATQTVTVSSFSVTAGNA
jgi:hypothetical protein